jgi:hypothetical protein
VFVFWGGFKVPLAKTARDTERIVLVLVSLGKVTMPSFRAYVPTPAFRPMA